MFTNIFSVIILFRLLSIKFSILYFLPRWNAKNIILDKHFK